MSSVDLDLERLSLMLFVVVGEVVAESISRPFPLTVFLLVFERTMAVSIRVFVLGRLFRIESCRFCGFCVMVSGSCE